jgi:uncharacterized protein YcgI (DUF1989 family)
MVAVFADLSDFLCARTTRSATERLFPGVGAPFVSVSYRPMFLFEEDGSPRVHDLVAAAATQGRRPEIVPDPVDWFQHTPVNEDGEITVQAALTGPGDSVTLRALADVFVVVTSCSMDVPGKLINGDVCTPIGVEVIA